MITKMFFIFQSSFERSTTNKDEPSKIDYKALWEASQLEIKQLKEIILANERELEEARHSIEKYTNAVFMIHFSSTNLYPSHCY